MEYLSSSYLYAIQLIPGETPQEKLKEIGRIVSRVIADMHDESDFTRAINEQRVPETYPTTQTYQALVPLIKVLVGVKIKSHAFVIEALKSDDIYLITEALRAKWFYDGSKETITNYKYFSTEILPYVSMCTRRKIVKKLAIGLSAKNNKLAEEFFSGFVSAYGVQEATNFLPACKSEFIYEAIIKYKIILSNKMLKVIYRKYPAVALRYLQFANYKNEMSDEIDRTMYRILNINEYESFLPLLITNHPEVFVSLQEICHTSDSLGNRRTMMFLKNAKDILIQRPRDIIDLMPLKLIYDNLKQDEFETMFGNILDNRWGMFNLDEILIYLEYYPKEKQAALIRNKVKEKYGYDLFEDVQNLTSKFLLLLPKEERFELARRIIKVRHKMVNDSEACWWSYLPIKEAIPAIKERITKDCRSIARQKLFSQLIYICKLNESKETLLEVLKFVDEKHKHERPVVICSMLDRITQEFDLDTFDQSYWNYLFSIIKRIKLSKATARDYWVLTKILKRNVHFCHSHNQPVEEIIDVIVKLFIEGRVGVSWMLLHDKPEYERSYLDFCFKQNYWLNMNYKKNVIEGIYSFNERHIKFGSSVPRLSIKDYPHLLKIVEETLKQEQNEESSWITYTKEKLKNHEPDLYDSWFNKGKDETLFENNCDELPYEDNESLPAEKIKRIYLTEGIIALKRNYMEIRNNWEQYYECCMNEINMRKPRRVKIFLKALRWYQNVPIEFAKRCIEEGNFRIMSYIFDGITFSKIAEYYMPMNNDQFIGYINTPSVTASVRNASTPISIDLVQRYFQCHFMYSAKNYINDGLKLWSYVAYRTSSDRMILLSKILSQERLFMKKHAIRLMNAMAARNDLAEFFSEMWKKEEHPLIREILAEKTRKLFAKRPSEETWNLMRTCLSELSINDDDILFHLMGCKAIPVDYAAPFAELVVLKLKEFSQKGMSSYNVAKCLDQLLNNLKPDCTDYLTNDYYKWVIEHHLQNNYLEFKNADTFLIRVYLNPSSVHFDERLKYLEQSLRLFSETWLSLNLETRKFTVNFVDNLVKTVVYQVQKFKGNLKVVQSLSDILWTIAKPYQYAWSHIMLFLCTEYMRVEPSFKEFGKQVSEKICYLIDKYTPQYFMQIVEYINEFVCNFTFHDYSLTISARLSFIEGLIENNNMQGFIIAAKLLNAKIVDHHGVQLRQILQKLSEVNHPIVQSFL